MFNKKGWPRVALLLVVAMVTLWLMNNGFANDDQTYFKLDKGLFYLKQVYETVSRNYVDELDPEGVSKAAINGIVEELDPYTVFFEDKGNERIELITKGKYGGLGMEISKREGKVTVISPIDNTPAQKAGIRAGDVIIRIDSVSTSNMTLEDASNRLRGTIGTQVTLEIKRPGIEAPMTLQLTREEIVIKDVSYSDFIEPGTALIRLGSFSDKAADEVKEAIAELQKKGSIERVVLDLRGNPGGLLSAAVDVVNVFVPKGNLVVSTRGVHEEEAKYLTTNDALLPKVPLVVLVDGGSASASEIVSGAIQDLDRGIILGSPTFGKGLVQKVFPIDQMNDAFLKITTAKYYVPSGRCIQKEDYKKNKEMFVDLSDSTEYNNHIKYYTRNHRVVYGGGGIKPDIEMSDKKADQYMITLWSGGHFFSFAVDYLTKHPELEKQKSFELTDQVVQDFRNYLQSQDLDFNIEGEAQLKDFLDIAKKEGYGPEVTTQVEQAIQKLDQEKKNEFDKDIDFIKESLEAEFAEKMEGPTGRIQALLNHDKEVKKAITVLKNQQEYDQILAVK